MLMAVPHAGVPGPLQFFTMTQSNFGTYSKDSDPNIYFSPSMRVGLLCGFLFHPGKVSFK